MQEFVAYRRVSASERGRNDLSLQAQGEAILRFVQSRAGVLLRDFVEEEQGKGSHALERRPQLREALRAARQRGAILVVARHDRLSSKASFLSELIDSGVKFVAAETPAADAHMLRSYAAVAEQERARAGGRISAALQAKKRAALAQGRPNPLGHVASLQAQNRGRGDRAMAFARAMESTLESLRNAGMTQRAMVEELNRRGIRTAGGGAWTLVQLQRVLARLQARED